MLDRWVFSFFLKMSLHFSVFVSNGSEFQILRPAAEDNLRVCVFWQKSELCTQSWMISVTFPDIWMEVVPGDIPVPDYSCMCI